MTVGSQRLKAPSLSTPMAPGPEDPRTSGAQNPSTAGRKAQDPQEPRTTGAEQPQGFRIPGHNQEPRTAGPWDPKAQCPKENTRRTQGGRHKDPNSQGPRNPRTLGSWSHQAPGFWDPTITRPQDLIPLEQRHQKPRTTGPTRPKDNSTPRFQDARTSEAQGLQTTGP